MLAYHPATDYFHCWMRIASILTDAESESLEFDRVRVLDFWMCFPSEIAKSKIPRAYSAELRRLVCSLPRAYEDSASFHQYFIKLGVIQRQVSQDMVAKGILRRDGFKDGLLVRNLESAHSELLERISQNWKLRSLEWYRLTLDIFVSFPLNGQDGLKARSGLLEYRYDEEPFSAS